MFSGGESNEGMNPMNPLGSFGFVNQAAVTNALAAGQNIDWAQLAQQWIQMRDNPETDLKEAPPPPNISFGKTSDDPTKIAKFEEKGEADMDMDDEDPSDEKSLAKLESKILAASVLQQQHNMNQPWFMDQAATSSNLGTQLAPQRLANNQQWNAWPNRDGLPQTNVPSPTVNRPINPTAHIPSLLKINVPHPNEIRAMPDVPNQTDTAASMMDAAKRKGLPAWIREGLEKMEREKQKQMEKQQQVKDNIYSSEDDTDPVKSPKNIMVKSLITNNDARDNEDEDLTDNEATSGELLSSNHLTAMRNIDATSEYDEDSSNSVGKSYEQKLADLMIVVRRTLTELLLEVTNEEIAKVADESLKSFKSKASSAQVIRKSALSTITGKLGLAAYGDSSSDEDSNDDDDDNSSKKLYQSESDNNSEDEIKNIIRSKRRAFVKISDEIEERAATAAVREEEKLKYFLRKEEEEERENRRKKQERSQSKDHASFSGYSGQNIGKGYDRDFGETTETKLQHLNGKRQKDRSARKERTTRFSDNKDKKYVALAATAAFITNMNATGSTTGTTSTTAATTTTLSSNLQHQPVPDFNGLLPEYRNAGMNNILNAADAALEKALKRKSSHSPDKYSRRRHRDGQYTSSKKRQRRDSSRDSRSHTESTSTSSSSTSSTSSSDSDSSTSRSSHNSKDQKRSTATKKSSTHSPHRSESKKSDKSSRDRWDKRRGDDDKRKYASSSSSYAKRDHESSSSSRYRRRHDSSDSDDDYHRRKYDSHYSRNSSHSRTHTSSSSSRRDRDRDRDHSRSRSRSTYSSSSTRRH